MKGATTANGFLPFAVALLSEAALETAVRSDGARRGRNYLFGVCGSSKRWTVPECGVPVVGCTPTAEQAASTDTNATHATARRKTEMRMAISYARLTAA